jgi:DNA uptake protein ComE-like DNA-binding protein
MQFLLSLLIILLLSIPVLAGEKTVLIDINNAPITELDKLEVKNTAELLSERIQAGRPYIEINDLVTKKVISPREFKAIKDLVTIGTDSQ